MKIDHIYVVSIDYSDSNISDTLNRINNIGLPNISTYTFRGVNGYAISNSELTQNNLRTYPKWNLSNDSNDNLVSDSDNKFWQRDMTSGEVGCVLSHIGIWEDAYANGYENILIYEDDVVSGNIPFDWDVLNKLEVLDYDLFYLGRFPQTGFKGVVDTPLDDYDQLCVPGYSYHTHAYMLSKSGISKLVENYIPILKQNLVPADEFLPSICNWTPREDLNDLFPGTINAFGLTDWQSGILQIRNEEIGNSLTQPNND